jgi:hypothetical protein
VLQEVDAVLPLPPPVSGVGLHRVRHLSMRHLSVL